MLVTLLPAQVVPYFPAISDWKVNSYTLIVWVPVIMLCAGLAKATAGFGYTLNQQAIALHFGANFREKMFDAILRLPWFENRKYSAGQWMSVIMNDVLFLQNRLADMLTCFVRGGVLVGSCLIAMLVIHYPTGLFLLFLAPIGAFLMGRTGKRIAWFAEKFQRELSRMAAAVLDIRNRFDFIRSQSGERTEFERFDKLNTEYYAVMRKSILVRSAFAPALEFVGFLVFAVIMILVHKRYLGVGFSGETMVQFFAALGLISRLAETTGVLKRSLETFEGVKRAALFAPTRIGVGEPFANDVVITKMAAGFGARIEFYADKLPIKLGTAVAIVGPSGSGKSTLIRTLAGLLPPMEWQASMKWEELANSSSMVSQDPYLFDESLRENLTYGQVKIDDQKIWSALRAVNLAHEVEERGHGLDEIVHPTQGNLSGGQIQRLVIARSLLRNASLWLFDEATSAVDASTEKDIVDRVIGVAREKNKALLYVTHRMQWLQKFDEIWFIENGAIQLKGSFNELVMNTRFSQFVAHTQREEGQ